MHKYTAILLRACAFASQFLRCSRRHRALKLRHDLRLLLLSVQCQLVPPASCLLPEPHKLLSTNSKDLRTAARNFEVPLPWFFAWVFVCHSVTMEAPARQYRCRYHASTPVQKVLSTTLHPPTPIPPNHALKLPPLTCGKWPACSGACTLAHHRALSFDSLVWLGRARFHQQRSCPPRLEFPLIQPPYLPDGTK